MSVSLSLAGQTALVTGAATGIGRAIALKLSQAGARVVINHLNQPQEAATLVQAISTAQTAALAKFLSVPVVSHQSEFSPLKLDPLFDGLFDQTMMDGMSFLAWSPLGGQASCPV